MSGRVWAEAGGGKEEICLGLSQLQETHKQKPTYTNKPRKLSAVCKSSSASSLKAPKPRDARKRTSRLLFFNLKVQGCLQAASLDVSQR